MASHPPSTCCTVGVKHEGEITGESIKIGSINAYVAKPTGKTIHEKTAILFLPDVIGIWKNSQLIADQYAANGFYTLIPDLFHGDQLKLNRPVDFDFPGWLAKHNKSKVDPVVEKSIAYLKEQGYTKIGSVGYCFGAKYTIRFLAEGKGIDVGFVAHPSFVDEEEVEAITGPLSIAAAETDTIFTTEKRHKTEELLIKTKLPYQINLYSGVSHGFSVRCDTSKKLEKYAKEAAFLQAVQWFDEHLV